MEFNVRGLGPNIFQKLKIYLGLIFKPPGSFVTAQAELYTKACKAWFAISHIVYQSSSLSMHSQRELTMTGPQS